MLKQESSSEKKRLIWHADLGMLKQESSSEKKRLIRHADLGMLKQESSSEKKRLIRRADLGMLKQESSSEKKGLIWHTASPLTLNFSVLTYTQSQQKQKNLLHLFPSLFPTSSSLCLLIGKKRVIGGGSTHLCKVRLNSSKKQKSWRSNFRASFTKKSSPRCLRPSPSIARERHLPSFAPKAGSAYALESASETT